jgi:biotin carboxylase
MKKLLILGASLLQIPIIRTAKEMGVYTISVDWNEDAPGRPEADEFFCLSTNDTENLLALSVKLNVDGVITNSDFPMRTASRISKHRGLKGLQPISAFIATNKLLLREVLSESGVNSPWFRKINRVEDIEYCAEQFGYPFILKPVDSSASRGVHLITNIEQISQAYTQAKAHAKNGILIAEEFIDGQEFSVEAITHKGKTQIVAVTEKLTTGAPHFVETGHMIPAAISRVDMDDLQQTVVSAIEAIGLNEAITHTELKINKKGFIIIEIGPRLGGDYITTDLVPLATGYDLVKNSIRLALGLPLDVLENNQRAAGIAFLTPPEGIVQSVDGLSNLSLIEGYVKAELFVKAGDQVSNVRSSMDRAGYVIVDGATRDEVTKGLKRALSEIIINTRER